MQLTQQETQQIQQSHIDDQLKYKIQPIGKYWKCFNNGREAGKYNNYTNNSSCHLNGSQYVRIYKDQKTKQLLIERFYVQPKIDGTVSMQDQVILSLGYSKHMNIWGNIPLRMDDFGSRQLKVYGVEISERQEGQNRFYITYDKENKIWRGIWGKPKYNWKLVIGDEGEIIVSAKWKLQQKDKSEKMKIEAKQKTKLQQQK